MSRVINIKGKVLIHNINLAKEAIYECGFDIEIKNNYFVFDKYDYYDGLNKENEISNVENLYMNKFNIYIEEVEEKERFKIAEEKKISREEKVNLMIANAKKQGYKLKKEIRENNTIKLVLQKRIY